MVTSARWTARGGGRPDTGGARLGQCSGI